MKKVLIVMLVMASLVFSSCAKRAEVTENPKQSQTEETQEDERIEAPDFELTTLKGKKVKLSDYKGKIVVMNFFTTWCPPCKAELPEFVKTVEEYKGKDVEFLFIDVQEEKKTVEKFLQDEGYSFDPLMDPEANVFAYTYGLRGFPTTFIVDREGYFVEGFSGQINKKTLTDSIEKGLAK